MNCFIQILYKLKVICQISRKQFLTGCHSFFKSFFFFHFKKYSDALADLMKLKNHYKTVYHHKLKVKVKEQRQLLAERKRSTAVDEQKV